MPKDGNEGADFDGTCYMRHACRAKEPGCIQHSLHHQCGLVDATYAQLMCNHMTLPREGKPSVVSPTP